MGRSHFWRWEPAGVQRGAGGRAHTFRGERAFAVEKPRNVRGGSMPPVCAPPERALSRARSRDGVVTLRQCPRLCCASSLPRFVARALQACPLPSYGVYGDGVTGGGYGGSRISRITRAVHLHHVGAPQPVDASRRRRRSSASMAAPMRSSSDAGGGDWPAVDVSPAGAPGGGFSAAARRYATTAVEARAAFVTRSAVFASSLLERERRSARVVKRSAAVTKRRPNSSRTASAAALSSGPRLPSRDRRIFRAQSCAVLFGIV